MKFYVVCNPLAMKLVVLRPVSLLGYHKEIIFFFPSRVLLSTMQCNNSGTKIILVAHVIVFVQNKNIKLCQFSRVF